MSSQSPESSHYLLIIPPRRIWAAWSSQCTLIPCWPSCDLWSLLRTLENGREKDLQSQPLTEPPFPPPSDSASVCPLYFWTVSCSMWFFTSTAEYMGLHNSFHSQRGTFRVVALFSHLSCLIADPESSWEAHHSRALSLTKWNRKHWGTGRKGRPGSWCPEDPSDVSLESWTESSLP